MSSKLARSYAPNPPLTVNWNRRSSLMPERTEHITRQGILVFRARRKSFFCPMSSSDKVPLNCVIDRRREKIMDRLLNIGHSLTPKVEVDLFIYNC